MGYEAILIGAGVLLLLLFMIKKGRSFFPFLISMCARFVIAGLLLYGVNVCFGQEGIYIPINEYTLLFSGVLGIPGIAALVILQKTMV